MIQGGLDTLRELLLAALPSVRRKPLPSLPRSLYRYVFKISGKQQIRLCLLTFLVFPLSMVPLELQRRIINNAIEEPDLRLLITLGGAYLALVLLHGGLKYARNLYQGRIAEGVIRVLRKRIAASLAQESAENDVKEGARVSMMAAEAEALGGFVGEALSFPLLQIGILLSVFGYMLAVEPLIAAVAFAFFVPSLVVVPYVQAMINRNVEARTQLLRELGDEMVRPDEAEEERARARLTRFDRLIDDIYVTRLRIYLLKYLLKFLNNFLGQLGPLSILLLGGYLVIAGQTELGTIVAFLSGYERMIDPARELLSFYRRFSRMRVQYRLVAEVMAGPANGGGV